MGLFSFSNHLTNHHFLEIFSSRCPKDAGPGGRLGGAEWVLGGGAFLTWEVFYLRVPPGKRSSTWSFAF